MSRLSLIVFTFLCISCNQYSDHENFIINTSHKLISNNSALKNAQIKTLIKKMDEVIHEEGNRDRDILDKLNVKLIAIDTLNLKNPKNIVELNSFIKKHNINKTSTASINILSNCKDTILLNSWKNSLKIEILNYYASKVGSSTMYCFHTIIPFISFDSRIVEKGQAIHISFFLGSLGYPPELNGKGIINSSNKNYAEIKFLPNQSQNKGVWKGYYAARRDTIEVKIPYEIRDCK